MKEMQIPYVGRDHRARRGSLERDHRAARKRRGLDLSQKVPESEKALREQLRTTTVQMPEVKDEESLTKVMDIAEDASRAPDRRRPGGRSGRGTAESSSTSTSRTS
jgi:hypothetical protein